VAIWYPAPAGGRRAISGGGTGLGAPLRLAANLAWGTWRFSRADDLARRGPSELGRRVVRTLFSLARKPKPFDVLVYFSAIYKVILPEIEGLDMAIESTPSEEKPEILVSEAQARRDFLKKGGTLRGGHAASHHTSARHELELQGNRQIGRMAGQRLGGQEPHSHRPSRPNRKIVVREI
jgi:hypothetical protein